MFKQKMHFSKNTAIALISKFPFEATEMECKYAPLRMCNVTRPPPRQRDLSVMQGSGMEKSLTCRPQYPDDNLPFASRWLANILGDKSGKPYKLLKQMAVWHLEGRQMLHGNPISVPFLGTPTFFQVETAVSLCTEWAQCCLRKRLSALLQHYQRSDMLASQGQCRNMPNLFASILQDSRAWQQTCISNNGEIEVLLPGEPRQRDNEAPQLVRSIL